MLLDLIIRNGRIVDGNGQSCIRKDLGVKHGKIQVIGDLQEVKARQEFSADDKVVCPGFIDVHAHSEISIWQDPSCIAKLSQGVTTEVTGQCGISAFPILPEAMENIMKYASPVLGSSMVAWPWNNYEIYKEELSRKGIAINQVNLVGHGNLRINAMGFESRKAEPTELLFMREMLLKELQQGAFGLSSGLVYAPGAFSDIEEMVALAKVCASAGGYYTTHMRNEGSRLIESAAEAIEVCRQSGVTTVISHLKAVGKPNHGKVLEVLNMMDEATAEGLPVYGDCYPYIAGSTTLTIVLPPWTLEKGIEGLLKQLKCPIARERIRKDFQNGIDGWENRSVTIGWNKILVASLASDKNRCLEGLSIEEISQIRGKDEVDTLLDLLLEERGAVTALLIGSSEKDISAALAHDRVMVCSDGLPVGGKPHPRLYGAITKYLAEYADLKTEEGLIKAVHKLTGLPASIYSLGQRGTLQLGNWADITIMDPNKVKDLATYTDPRQLSEGIEAVFVGGELAYREKDFTGVYNGQFLKLREGNYAVN